MTDENFGARNGPTVEDAHFFAHLELIGLKNAIKQGAYDLLKEKVDHFVVTSKAEIEKEQAEFKDEFGFGIDFQIDLDSIYIWTQHDCRLYQFDDLLQIVIALLVNGFKQGMPLRGMIGYGDFKVERLGDSDVVQDNPSFDNKEFHRIVLNESHGLGLPMNWSGVVLTRKAWEKVMCEFAKGEHEEWGRVICSVGINSVEDLRGRYLLPCDVPFEDGGCRRYNAINWNYNPNDGLSEDVIRKAFEGPCSTYDSDIKSKQDKTLQFFECSQRAAITRKFSSMENFLII